MRVILKKDNKVYTITFDEYNVVDTVECAGKLLLSANRVVKQIITNQGIIVQGFVPAGFARP